MTKPYGLISDTHNHNWSAFSGTLASGVNSRLQIILDKTWDAAVAVKNAGGDTLYHAGDIFHARGAVPPSVLNPTKDMYRKIVRELKMNIIQIPGNHDLESNDSTMLTAASVALEEDGINIMAGGYSIFGSNRVVVVPWYSSVQKLLERIADACDALTHAGSDVSDYDLIIHAPVDGVIMGIPSHGLSADILATFGFKRVFSGHYHNYRDLGQGVYSIGALTHQTWSDVNSKAGFLLVYPDYVEHHETDAPKFVDYDLINDPRNPPQFEGNYVRVKMEVKKESDVAKVKAFVTSKGAAGVVVHPVRTTTVVARNGSTVKTGASLQQSVTEFIKNGSFQRVDELARYCDEILAEVK